VTRQEPDRFKNKSRTLVESIYGKRILTLSSNNGDYDSDTVLKPSNPSSKLRSWLFISVLTALSEVLEKLILSTNEQFPEISYILSKEQTDLKKACSSINNIMRLVTDVSIFRRHFTVVVLFD